MNEKIKLGLIFISLIVLSSPTYALSFGTHVKNSEVNIIRSGGGSFDIVFFSRDAAPVKFLLTLKEYPNDFTITYPESFELNTRSNEEYILIDNEYVRTETIRINVNVPENTKLGEYEILLTASSVNSGKQANSLGVNTEKTFLLKVNVLDEFSDIKQISKTKNQIDIESRTSENIVTESKEEVIANVEEREREDNEIKEEVSPTGMITFLSDKTIFWTICIVSIIFVSYLIYRRGHKTKEENYVQN